MRFMMVVVAAMLLAAPAADALQIGSKSLRVRDSEEYSPETAWDMGVYGCGVTVAVFDNGVDDKHPHLDGKVIAGYDSTRTQAVWTQANGGNPQPIQGTHGTPVAGLAVSHGGKPFFRAEDFPGYGDDDKVGIAPCAWMVDVMFSDVQNDDGFEGDVIEAFDWAIENRHNDWGDSDPSNDGIDIITMSWSPNDETDGTHPICEAANRAVAAGIVVLGSAGNSGGVERPDLGCPTGADGALSIANLWNERTVDRSDDILRESSTWGPRTDDGDEDLYEELKPDVATPGHGVRGAGASRLDGSDYAVVCFGYEEGVGPVNYGAFQGCEVSFSGTSAATPMTAGVVALLLEVNKNLTPADVKEILHQTAVPHPEGPPSKPELNAKWNHRYGFGMTDAYAAIQLAKVWPGIALGRDLDSDGVRDYLDASPMDPSDARMVAPRVTQAAGGMLDSDGDGILDADDPAPLVPHGADMGAADEGEDAPGLGFLLAAVLAGLAWVRRR